MHGFRLDDLTITFSWRDLLVMVRRWGQTTGTALSDSLHGRVWSTTDQLLAALVDATNNANWQRAGKKSTPKPKPIPRPWEKSKGRQLGSDPIPISQFDAWWDAANSRHSRAQ